MYEVSCIIIPDSCDFLLSLLRLNYALTQHKVLAIVNTLDSYHFYIPEYLCYPCRYIRYLYLTAPPPKNQKF